MNRTTKTAIDILTTALAAIGLTTTSVYPAEPVSSYDGSQCTIGYNTINYFLRDDDDAAPFWCLEITYEDGTYDSHDDITTEFLTAQLRTLAETITAE